MIGHRAPGPLAWWEGLGIIGALLGAAGAVALGASSLHAQGFLPGGGGTSVSCDSCWPDDPASHGVSGWTVISDQGWTGAYPTGIGTVTAVQGTNWTANPNSSACGKILDATAPGQGAHGGWLDSVLQVTYANGYVAGVAPCTVDVTFSAVDSIYVGFWFKQSSNFYGEQSCVLKMLSFDSNYGSYFYEACGVGNAAMYLQGVGEPDSTQYNTYNLSPGPAGVQDTSQMVRNGWHQAEMEWVKTSPDAFTVDYWLDGKHQVHCTPTSTSATCNWNGGPKPAFPDSVSANGSFIDAHLYPDWGGGGDTLKTGTQYLYLSHMRVSAK